MRPRVATSVTPLAEADLERALIEIADAEELVAAAEAVQRNAMRRPVTAWVLEPAGASEAVRTQVVRLMDRFSALEGEGVVCRRSTVSGELPAGTRVHELRDLLFGEPNEEGDEVVLLARGSHAAALRRDGLRPRPSKAAEFF